MIRLALPARQTYNHSVTNQATPHSIRPATAGDLERINEIYNHYVHHSTCTYQTEPETIESRRAWFESHGKLHPIFVAERNGEVAGWASLSRFHPRAAYGRTVENSIYIHDQARRCGLGAALLRRLVDDARDLGHHTIIAGISADQSASVELHRKFGFTEAARLREVGFKFGQWLDVVYLQLIL